MLTQPWVMTFIISTAVVWSSDVIKVVVFNDQSVCCHLFIFYPQFYPPHGKAWPAIAWYGPHTYAHHILTCLLAEGLTWRWEVSSRSTNYLATPTREIDRCCQIGCTNERLATVNLAQLSLILPLCKVVPKRDQITPNSPKVKYFIWNRYHQK